MAAFSELTWPQRLSVPISMLNAVQAESVRWYDARLAEMHRQAILRAEEVEQRGKMNEARYKPELFTKISIVSDPELAPKIIDIPRGRKDWFELIWWAGVQDSAIVSALVDTKGKVKAVRFRQPGGSAKYDSAVVSSLRSSLFVPLRSSGFRVEAWVRLKYTSKYGSDCDRPEIVRD